MIPEAKQRRQEREFPAAGRRELAASGTPAAKITIRSVTARANPYSTGLCKMTGLFSVLRGYGETYARRHRYAAEARPRL